MPTGATVTAGTDWITAAKMNLKVETVDGGDVVVVADKNVVGGVPVIHRITMAGGVTASVDVLLTYKERVIDAWVHNDAVGTASDTITIKNITTAISNVISINVADETVTHCTTLDDAQIDIGAGTNLRVTETDGGGTDSPACTVYVLCIRVT